MPDDRLAKARVGYEDYVYLTPKIDSEDRWWFCEAKDARSGQKALYICGICQEATYNANLTHRHYIGKPPEWVGPDTDTDDTQITEPACAAKWREFYGPRQ